MDNLTKQIILNQFYINEQQVMHFSFAGTDKVYNEKSDINEYGYTRSGAFKLFGMMESWRIVSRNQPIDFFIFKK